MYNSSFTIKRSSWRSTCCVVMVFCYIFSFYIIRPLNSSIIVGFLALSWLIISKNYLRTLKLLSKRYFLEILFLNVLLISLSIVFSLAHGTMDYTFTSILFAQLIHLILGSFLICLLYIKYKIKTSDIIKYIIVCYILQSFIELIASFIPSIASIMKYFTGGDLQDRYNGVRGLALTSAAGWSLGLTFGIVFILFSKRYLIASQNSKNVTMLLILVSGCFFAGRTGLVGLILGLVYFILNNKILSSISIVLKIVIFVIFLIAVVFIVFPEYFEFANNYILPFALEPIYNFIEGKGLTSKSTDRLDAMWDINISDNVFLIGTGHLIEYDGQYFMHTDVGVLRNILYWGIIGYFFLVLYQIIIMYPSLKNRATRGIMLMIFCYLIVCECKAVTLGLNKMTFSILFLISSFVTLNNSEHNISHGRNINYYTRL